MRVTLKHEDKIIDIDVYHTTGIVSIYVDGVWATDGVWSRLGRVENATGNLGESVYNAIDSAIQTSINKGMVLS